MGARGISMCLLVVLFFLTAQGMHKKKKRNCFSLDLFLKLSIHLHPLIWIVLSDSPSLPFASFSAHSFSFHRLDCDTQFASLTARNRAWFFLPSFLFSLFFLPYSLLTLAQLFFGIFYYFRNFTNTLPTPFLEINIPKANTN